MICTYSILSSTQGESVSFLPGGTFPHFLKHYCGFSSQFFLLKYSHLLLKLDACIVYIEGRKGEFFADFRPYCYDFPLLLGPHLEGECIREYLPEFPPPTGSTPQKSFQTIIARVKLLDLWYILHG